jgi:hypothetical protein
MYYWNCTNGKITTQLYDKRDDFNFSIVNFLSLCSDIPSSPAYGVYTRISQLIRYARACSTYDQFFTMADSGRQLTHMCVKCTAFSMKIEGKLHLKQKVYKVYSVIANSMYTLHQRKVCKVSASFMYILHLGVVSSNKMERKILFCLFFFFSLIGTPLNRGFFVFSSWKISSSAWDCQRTVHKVTVSARGWLMWTQINAGGLGTALRPPKGPGLCPRFAPGSLRVFSISDT